ncbi:MAG: response regulator transcription factor [Erysipelotrichaceae bacterium]|nr:response regulator transcription factor [Erysipelotrichaceae bacterium]
MLKILIVDDEINIRNLFKIRLENEGYEVYTAKDGLEALDVVYDNIIDMCIVDVMMPNLDGNSFVKKIRSENFNMPIIMVTAKGELDDKIEAFDSGIDDYMTKPIEFDELLLRMKALFRRAKIVTDKKIVIGDTVLEYDTLTITNNKLNLNVTLTKKEFSILYKLLSYPERTFTKGQLFDEFWGLDNYGDVDAVKVYISKIRSIIEPFPEIDIATIRGIGYRGIKKDEKN